MVGRSRSSPATDLDTLNLGEMYVSRSVADELRDRQTIEVSKNDAQLFGADGALTPF